MNSITWYGPLNDHYSRQILKTIKCAAECYPRLLALRVDLRLPGQGIPARTDSACISRFFDALNAKLKADAARKKKEGKRVHPCTVRYMWAREFNQDGKKKHYHVALLLNKDAYAFLGDFNKEEGTLAAMITQAWTSALGVAYPEFQSLPHFPKNPCYFLDKKNPRDGKKLTALIERVAYLAKETSKISKDGERNFGTSRN
ncbi:inovirus Gp2 family protein [Serratia fonticola]|uniref:inovirus Gp2 family protein n=1 Tax=Serratia fonticola TaxID=47917 RepID=UPI0034C6077D